MEEAYRCNADVPSAPTRKRKEDRHNVKEVGIRPVRSDLCTPQLALSTAVRNGVLKTKPEGPAVETCSKRESKIL